MAVETKRSFCRFCHAACAIDVDVDTDSDTVLAIHGVKDDPMFEGYTCVKGRHLPQQHHHLDRLRTPFRKGANGSFSALSSAAALDEIAEKVAATIETYGPRAVATYCGTAAYQNATVLPIAKAFHQAIGSPSFYTSLTIDQPAKLVAPLRHGMWMAGGHSFETSDVSMVIGCNTLVSQYSWPGGIPATNPLVNLRRAKANGLKLIVIDPRRTEVAEYADMHVQVRAGEDPTLLAAMIRHIIRAELYDREFVVEYVNGLDDLRAAVDKFDVLYAAGRTAVSAAQIVAAAELFAAGPRGTASTGTGPNMAPHSSLTEHLVISLNTLCGRYNREGEVMANPGGAFAPLAPVRAQVIPPRPSALTKGAPARMRGLHVLREDAPTAVLNDEILVPGEGQIRALFTIGGNPVVAWPDQRKTVEALQTLDLHVVVDVQMSASAKLAHYVIASELCLERPDVPTTVDRWFDKTYSHYTPAIIEPQGDVIGEWEVYREVARRLGLTLRLPGGDIAPDDEVTADDVLDLIYVNTKVPLADARAHVGGRLHPEFSAVVAAADATDAGRFELTPDGIADELAQVRVETSSGEVIDGFDPAVHTFRLTSRRLKSVFNSSGREIEDLRSRESTNFAHIHPEDLAELGIADGAIVRISSPRSAIRGIAKSERNLKRGSISMAHAWGGVPDDDLDLAIDGSTTAMLIDNASGYDKFSGIPVMSAIPVSLSAE